MKNIFIVIVVSLALLLLSACVTEPNNSNSNESLSESSAVLASIISSEDVSSSTSKKYSFSEIDTLYGPDAFSVNDLAKIFGEPEFIGGYRWGDGAYAINVRFEDIQFDLVANNGEKLNFIVKDDNASYDFRKYTVTESDKSVRMKPLISWISSNKWSLPRGMKIGDSRSKLTVAYNGDTGQENAAEGQLSVSYNYGESGHIAYIFYDDKLDSVSIMWYDINLLR